MNKNNNYIRNIRANLHVQYTGVGMYRGIIQYIYYLILQSVNNYDEDDELGNKPTSNEKQTSVKTGFITS